MAELRLLKEEWTNRGAPDYLDGGRLVSMKRLEELLLERKHRVAYAENWRQLATRELNRHAHDDTYVTALLYLLDERVIPVADLQGSVHLNLGHIYRQLDRAGVQWCANGKSAGARLRRPYFSHEGALYIRPAENIMLVEGERRLIPAGLDIYRGRDDDAQNDDEKDEILGVIPGVHIEAPVPIFPGRKPRAKLPPKFPERKKV